MPIPCACPVTSTEPFEPPHDKTNKVAVRLAKSQISLGIHPRWSVSSLCAQRVAKDPSCLHEDSEDLDQTGRNPRLIWVFAGHTVTLLVLSCLGLFGIAGHFYPLHFNVYTTAFTCNLIETVHDKTEWEKEGCANFNELEETDRCEK